MSLGARVPRRRREGRAPRRIPGSSASCSWTRRRS